ncbi:MAG: response regulator transcription factor [Acidobacteriota bacterium]|nr:response regulator transcription factor [Acidobacteriota bacterium]
MKLLIVEDNASMRRFIKSIVSDLADEIEECGDGADVLAAYEKHMPEWVLMDVKMPRTDGITASRLILAQYPQAKICIVTECADAKTRQAASDAGVRDYVLKDNLFNIRSIISKENEKTNLTFLVKPT